MLDTCFLTESKKCHEPESTVYHTIPKVNILSKNLEVEKVTFLFYYAKICSHYYYYQNMLPLGFEPTTFLPNISHIWIQTLNFLLKNSQSNLNPQLFCQKCSSLDLNPQLFTRKFSHSGFVQSIFWIKIGLSTQWEPITTFNLVTIVTIVTIVITMPSS